MAPDYGCPKVLSCLCYLAIACSLGVDWLNECMPSLVGAVLSFINKVK